MLLQYNSTGALLWTRLAGTAGYDYGYGVSVSADGRYIYVTGSVYASGTYTSSYTDIVLYQYNSTGWLMWTRQSGTSGSDQGRGVAASADGQFVYMTGSVQGSLNGQPRIGDGIALICDMFSPLFDLVGYYCCWLWCC